MSKSNRRSDGRRDDRPNDEGDRRNRDRDDSKSRRDHGSSRSGGRSDHANTYQRDMYGGGMGGGPRGGQGAFSGIAFSENELMSDLPKKKFTGRCRLFVGNLPNEVKEIELKELFSPHGDIAECYLSGKGFAFLRMDTRANAESAKEAIDGKVIHGRQVRVRFAVHGAALRVKELSPTVSNEMLYHAFSHFGDVERAVHIVDEKGRPTGEGIVEFERKPSCNDAIAAIREKVFLLTASPKPLIVEPLDPRDEDDGLAERMIPRTPQLNKERELGPRFPAQNSFEYVYGMKWKELYEMEKQRRSQMEEDLKEARRRLEQDMELAYQDYQAQMLREDLQRRQQELERLEAARRERMATMRPGGPMIGGPMSGPPPMAHFPGHPGGYPTQGMPPLGAYNIAAPGVPPMGAGAPHPFAQGPLSTQQGMPQGGPTGGGPPQGGQPRPGGPPGVDVSRPPGAGGPGIPGVPIGSAGRASGANMLEGVQRLLSIFKNDPSGGRPQGVPPPHLGGMFNSPQDYPPEKRIRR